MSLADRLAARPRLLVALAAALPFLGTLANQPVLDDGWAVLDNPLVWRLSNVGRIFRELYGFAGDPSVRGPYRPLTTLSYALNWAVHGRSTPGYHLVNVALHVAASLLVLALARRLLRAAGSAAADHLALLTGLLFALHPAHVEAVATIFGRTEPLSACFSLAALLLALDFRRGRWQLPAGLLALCGGVLSKEVAMVTPALFLLVAGALPAAAGLEARPGLSGAAPRRAALQALLAAGVLALSVLPYLAARGPLVAAPAVARWFGDAPARVVGLTMSRVLAEYWRILAFPGFLGGDFAYAARLPTLHAPTAGFWLGTAIWLAILAAGLGLWRRAPVVAVGLLWTFVALLPVMQILPVGVLLAERLLYLPSVGFCLAAAAGAGELAGAARRRGLVLGTRTAAGLAGLLLLGLGARTVARTFDWVDARAVWESEVRKAPREVVVNNNLAVEYNRLGRHREAVERLQVALEVAPWYWRARVNLGIALQHLGDGPGARRALLEAMRVAPEAMDPPYWLARLAAEEGRLEEAVAFAAQARRLAPEQAYLARAHGEYLLRLGRAEEARQALGEALALDPSDAEARRLLAQAGG